MHASDEELVSRTCEELSKPNNKETTPIRKLAKKKGKWAKYIIHLTKKDVQMANMPMERCSTLLSIRETTSSHDHHAPVRSAKIENSDIIADETVFQFM